MMEKNGWPISSDAAAIPRCGYWEASTGGSEQSKGHRHLELLTSKAQRIGTTIEREVEKNLGFQTPVEMFSQAGASTG